MGRGQGILLDICLSLHTFLCSSTTCLHFYLDTAFPLGASGLLLPTAWLHTYPLQQRVAWRDFDHTSHLEKEQNMLMGTHRHETYMFFWWLLVSSYRKKTNTNKNVGLPFLHFFFFVTHSFMSLTPQKAFHTLLNLVLESLKISLVLAVCCDCAFCALGWEWRNLLLTTTTHCLHVPFSVYSTCTNFQSSGSSQVILTRTLHFYPPQVTPLCLPLAGLDSSLVPQHTQLLFAFGCCSSTLYTHSTHCPLTRTFCSSYSFLPIHTTHTPAPAADCMTACLISSPLYVFLYPLHTCLWAQNILPHLPFICATHTPAASFYFIFLYLLCIPGNNLHHAFPAYVSFTFKTHTFCRTRQAACKRTHTPLKLYNIPATYLQHFTFAGLHP